MGMSRSIYATRGMGVFRKMRALRPAWRQFFRVADSALNYASDMAGQTLSNSAGADLAGGNSGGHFAAGGSEVSIWSEARGSEK